MNMEMPKPQNEILALRNKIQMDLAMEAIKEEQGEGTDNENEIEESAIEDKLLKYGEDFREIWDRILEENPNIIETYTQNADVIKDKIKAEMSKKIRKKKLEEQENTIH